MTTMTHSSSLHKRIEALESALVTNRDESGPLFRAWLEQERVHIPSDADAGDLFELLLRLLAGDKTLPRVEGGDDTQ